jgi:hypothetical protein
MRSKTTIFNLLVLVFLISLTGFAQTSAINPAQITFTNIDVPGAAATAAEGINNSGIITGTFFDSTGAAHGFLADKTGAFVREISFPGAAQTQSVGINERGDIVGSYVDGAGSFHGFLLQDGNFSTIDFPSATDTFPFDINDQGVIVGTYLDSAFLNHGFTLDKAGFHTVDDPAQASPSTELMSVNSRGDILGDFDVNFLGLFQGAFLFTHGSFVPFILPQATNGLFVVGLNNSGDIAGSFVGDDFFQHGFVSSNGNLIILDFPGALATAPIQINSSHNTVGIYGDGITTHSFLVTFDGPGSGAGVAAPAASAPLNNAAPAGQTIVCGSVQQALRSGSGPNAGHLACH